MSLVLPSVQARKRNRVTWQTQWWRSYVFAHKPRLWCDRVSLSHTHTRTHTRRCDVTLSLSLSLSLSLTHTRAHAHTHTHTHHVQNSAFEQSIANISTNNKTYSRWFRSARLSQQSQNFFLCLNIWANISTSWRRHVGACLNETF